MMADIDLNFLGAEMMEHPQRFVHSYITAGITRYVTEGLQPGSFLYAVLCNDLREAAGQADVTNFVALAAVVAYIYRTVPAKAWGSEERVKEWIKLGGLKGQMTVSSQPQGG